MRIVGVENNSFVDYPGKIAMVLFTEGCNFNCYYCHNRSIIRKSGAHVIYCPELIIKNLTKKKDFLDGIVISGGEPTIHQKLVDFLDDLKKSTNLPVKLDTNGSNPSMLRLILSKKLVDYIAMDIKAPKHKYKSICMCNVNTQDIDKSIKLIMGSGIDYEFRTTFVPNLYYQDIDEIATWVSGAKNFALQQYRTPESTALFHDARLSQTPHSADYINETLSRIKWHFENAVIRGL